MLLGVFGLGRGGAWSEDSQRANQVGWGFETPACGAFSLGGRGRPIEMVDVVMARPRMARRLRSCRVEQIPEEEGHRLPAALETCSTNVRRRHEKNTNVFKEKGRSLNSAAHQPASSLPEGGTHWHVATQNARCAKVSCMCKTTGILGETGYERGIPPGTSSLPGNAER